MRRWDVNDRQHCPDGIGAAVSQPDRLAVFQSGDRRFTYNLVRNLAALAP